MLFRKNPKIEKICLYCEKATCVEKEGETVVSCLLRKETSPDSHCFRFRYDPLKRTPKRLPPPTGLSEEDELHRELAQ